MKKNKNKMIINVSDKKGIEIEYSEFSWAGFLSRKGKFLFVSVFFLILCLMMFFYFVLNKSNHNTVSKNFTCETHACSTGRDKIIRKEKNYGDLVCPVCFSAFCIAGVICISVVLVKDDGGISFSKLEALNDAYFLAYGNEDRDLNYEETVEYPPEDKSLKGSNGIKKTGKRKNLHDELTKCYMNAVTEV